MVPSLEITTFPLRTWTVFSITYQLISYSAIIYHSIKVHKHTYICIYTWIGLFHLILWCAFRFVNINLDKTSISVWERRSEGCKSLRILLENFTTWTVYDALTRELLLQIPVRKRDCAIILGLGIKIYRPLLSVITLCH